MRILMASLKRPIFEMLWLHSIRVEWVFLPRKNSKLSKTGIITLQGIAAQEYKCLRNASVAKAKALT